MGLLKKVQLFFLLAIVSGCISNEISVKTHLKQILISDVSPTWLSRKGGEEVVINGNFKGLRNLTVTIDDQLCTNVTKISNSQLSCLSPGSNEIKNAQLKVFSFNKIAAQADVKYIGVLGQRSPSQHHERQRGLSLPVMVKSLDSKLFIGDLANRRIVGFNDFNSLGDRDFDFALGFTNTNQKPDSMPINLGQYRARELDYANGLFMFADGENNRVLIFDGYPKANQEAKIILGQPDLLSVTANNGGVSAKSLNKPMCAKFIDGKIFVSDALNNRILVWNSVPTENFQEADFVMGQPDFESVLANNGGLSASSLNMPLNLEQVGNKLFAADYYNGRVLIWNSIPTSNVAADSVLGQASLTSLSTTASSSIIKGPGGFKYHNSTFYLTDYGGNRVLVYKNFDPDLPISSGRAADIVLGQPDFSSTDLWLVNDKITAQSLKAPSSIEVHENKLYIADTFNNRILVYNHLPTDIVLDQHLAADGVIGQDDFSSSEANAKSYGPQYIFRPSSVAVFEGKLLINSESTNSISVWNSIPTDDFTPADFVLGQNGFGKEHTLSNQGLASPNASTIATVYQLLTHENKLYASDLYNNRILFWNTLTGINGQPADGVLGQGNFTTNTNSPISDSSLNGPAGMDVVNDKLVVADRFNNRMLIYNQVPTTSSSSVPADFVVGQADFTSGAVNGVGDTSAISPGNFNSPFNSVSWLGLYVVADHLNRRILVWNNFESFEAKENPRIIWGQDDFLSVDATSNLSANRSGEFLTVRVIDDVLYAIDPFNNRILTFDKFPVGTIMAPSGVIGQKDFISNKIKSPFGGESLEIPTGIFGLENYIFIADYYNNRVLMLPR